MCQKNGFVQLQLTLLFHILDVVKSSYKYSKYDLRKDICFKLYSSSHRKTGGYALHLWVIYSKILTSLEFLSKNRTKAHNCNLFMNLFHIKNIRKLRRWVVHLWTWKPHLLLGLCFPHTYVYRCTVSSVSAVSHPTSQR
jgi:hypothetical protein